MYTYGRGRYSLNPKPIAKHLSHLYLSVGEYRMLPGSSLENALLASRINPYVAHISPITAKELAIKSVSPIVTKRLEAVSWVT